MSERKLKSLTGGSGVHVFLVLWKAASAVQAYAEKSVSELEMCGSDFGVLEALLHKGPLPVNEIGKKVLLTSGSITVAVDRLETKGLVERRAHGTDRRARIVHLTKARQEADHTRLCRSRRRHGTTRVRLPDQGGARDAHPPVEEDRLRGGRLVRKSRRGGLSELGQALGLRQSASGVA